MNFLAALKLAISILPYIIEAVKAIEKEVGGSGKGSDKLEFIKGLVTSIADITGDVDKGVIASAVEKVVALLVRLFNVTGIFSKQ